MSHLNQERLAINDLLQRLPKEAPVWYTAQLSERLKTELDVYEAAGQRIRFAGVSAPSVAASFANTVGVFVSGAEVSEQKALSDILASCSRFVLIRPPTDEERASCGFGRSALRVVEGIDVIVYRGAVLFRPLGIKEFFVIC